MSTRTDEGDPAAGAALHAAFPGSTEAPVIWHGDVTVQVKPEVEAEVIRHAKEKLGFELFIDRLGADRGEDADPRFDVITILYNLDTNLRLHIRTTLPALDPVCPTLIHVFRGADWFEREAFDMYGIRFSGHPDLRRILMPEIFPDYPLRKEYPMEGLGNFAAPRRAIGGTRDAADGHVAIHGAANAPKTAAPKTVAPTAPAPEPKS
jgi:NADH-quinone oxidoreductase subunit C